MSRFNVQQPSLEDQRPAHEVFKSSAAPDAESFKSRFASSGKFTTEQLATGADVAEKAQTQRTAEEDAEEPEFDPNDTRSLYEKLKEQRDAKQEEWEEKHKFKNQMDHWRLDEDDAAFEEERVETMRKQQVEAQRQREEGLEFYKLARAAQERSSIAPPKTKPSPSPFDRKPGGTPKRKGLPLPVAPVKLVKSIAASGAAAPAQASAAASNAKPELKTATGTNEIASEDPPTPHAEPDADAQESGGLLPGMDEYGDDSDE